MTFSIAIRTITRKADYCRGTLTRLVETGSLQHPELLGLHISHGEGISPNANGCRAIQMAVRDGADWIIFLEDDVDMIDNFLSDVELWLEDWSAPNVLAYPLSCFYSDAVKESRRRGAWDRYPLDKYYGSQGFAIRTADALDFANWLTGLNKPFDRDVSFDIHLAQWHLLRRPAVKHVITPAPCFLDHTGEFSSIGPPGSWERVGRVAGFAGRQWSYQSDRRPS